MRYHLHGRRFRGTLLAPTVNETQTHDTDDHGEAVSLASRWSSTGWRVWLYEDQHHGRSALPSGGYRLVREW